jgi:hypothetical protein
MSLSIGDRIELVMRYAIYMSLSIGDRIELVMWYTICMSLSRGDRIGQVMWHAIYMSSCISGLYTREMLENYDSFPFRFHDYLSILLVLFRYDISVIMMNIIICD